MFERRITTSVFCNTCPVEIKFGDLPCEQINKELVRLGWAVYDNLHVCPSCKRTALSDQLLEVPAEIAEVLNGLRRKLE